MNISCNDKSLFVLNFAPWRVVALGVFFLVFLLPVCAVAQAPSLPGFDYNPEDFFNFDEPEGGIFSDPAAQAAQPSLDPTYDPSLPFQPVGPSVPGAPGVPGLGQPGQGAGVPVSGQLLDAIKEETRRQAFDAALEGLLPLRPEEIRTLLERYDRTQESVELPIYPAPRPQVAVENLSLDPGAKPKSVRVSHGYVTTFTVVDSTGAPWPIEDITWAGDFEIMQSSGEASNFIRITPRSEYAFGNMSMRLIGLQTPIILSIETARDIVHYRFDAIVPQIGPHAEAPLIQGGGISAVAGDYDMMKLLEGSMPSGAQKLYVDGADARTSAYSQNGMTYLRTPLTLLSPSWESSTASADGMRVYSMQASPVVLLSDQGRMVRVRLSSQGDF